METYFSFEQNYKKCKCCCKIFYILFRKISEIKKSIFYGNINSYFDRQFAENVLKINSKKIHWPTKGKTQPVFSRSL